MTTNVLNKFLRYVQIDTQSAYESDTYPSTAKQLSLLNLLVEEMIEIGISNVEIDAYGYVTGRIESNCDHPVPTIAFIAHVDTSPDVSGREVKPRIVDYKGGDLVVNQSQRLVIDAQRLESYVGHRLVVSDGTTLLGADDKAGVAEIMSAAEYLVTHPEIEHGPVLILFTPDEEVGHGVDHFQPADWGADYAYTVDGGEEGALEWETFNAASAQITLHGINYHPGYAHGKMINSQHLAMEIAQNLPHSERPETTTDREGFFHLTDMSGSVEQTTLHYIIRDHDREKFERRKQQITDYVNDVNTRYAQGMATIDIKDQYYNMGEVIKDHYVIVEIAEAAMQEAGIIPHIAAVRGGTDGSRLSFMGLPCPNIFSGSENIHSRLEFVSEQVMCNSVCVVVNIIKLFSQKVLEK